MRHDLFSQWNVSQIKQNSLEMKCYKSWKNNCRYDECVNILSMIKAAQLESTMSVFVCRWSRWSLCRATKRSPHMRLCPAWLTPPTTSPWSVTCAGTPDLWPPNTRSNTLEKRSNLTLDFFYTWMASETCSCRFSKDLWETRGTWTSRGELS